MSYIVAEPTNCKYCQSPNIIRFGTYEGVQRYYCKDCDRKFTGADTLLKMQLPVDRVSAAVAMYYEGLSLNEIKRMMRQIYSTDISDQGIYNWVERFTKDAIKITNNYHPDTGYVWMADETVIDIAGKQYWLLDVIDVKTRFLLASRLSPNRWMEDINIVLKEAYQRSGKIPKSIMTDHLEAYVRAIPSTFGAGAKHVQVKKFTSKPNNNIIERMQGTIKSRTKIMRDLKSLDTARLILDGFFVHYNYMRPHETLSKGGNDTTPAQKANIKFPYENWEQLVRNSQAAKSESPHARFDVPELPVHLLTLRERRLEYDMVHSREKRLKIKLGIPLGKRGRPKKNIQSAIQTARLDK
jgi:transposase-like protein